MEKYRVGLKRQGVWRFQSFLAIFFVTGILQRVKKATANWLATSQYDLETAQHMFQTGRYLYVIYMCHLALEKMLKAMVAEAQEFLPPKTHNLYHLVKLIDLEIEEPFKKLFADLNAASLPVRYPEDMQKLIAQYNQEIAKSYLEQTEACLKWLKHHPKLKKS